VAGCGRGARSFGRGGRLPGSRERGLRLGQFTPGGLVPFPEFRITRVEAVDLCLELLVFLLGGGGTHDRRVARIRQPVDLGLRGRRP
jgi:hypothetical protein